MGRKILKVEHDFDKIFICLSRLVVNSLKWQFAHFFTVFMINGNLTIFLKFLAKLCFYFSGVRTLFFKFQLCKLNIELCRIPILLSYLIVRKTNFQKKL